MATKGSGSPSSTSHSREEEELRRKELISQILDTLADVEQDLDQIRQDVGLLSDRVSETQKLLKLLLSEGAPIRTPKDDRNITQGSSGEEWTIDHILKSAETSKRSSRK